MTYWARSANWEGNRQSQKKHLTAVGEQAGCFAKALGIEDQARLAGLLHDIGKYGDLFQDVLEGREHGVDHWSMGASIAWKEYSAWYVALAIAAHHRTGLGRSDKGFIQSLRPKELTASGGRLSEADPCVLINNSCRDAPNLACGKESLGYVPNMLSDRLAASSFCG